MKFGRALTLMLVSLVLLGACVNSEPELVLSPDAAAGRDIANANGCASCHGKNGQGVTAPSWKGIYNASIALQDGTTTIGDDDYLSRAITDPQADIVDSWTIKMPENNLNDDQIDAIIAYIKELA